MALRAADADWFFGVDVSIMEGVALPVEQSEEALSGAGGFDRDADRTGVVTQHPLSVEVEDMTFIAAEVVVLTGGRNVQ